MRFCGSSGWGPVNGRGDDLTPCFQNCVFRLLPALAMIGVSLVQIGRIHALSVFSSDTDTEQPLGFGKLVRSGVRFGSSVVLTLLPFAMLVCHVVGAFDPLSASVLALHTLDGLAWGCALLVLVTENRHHLKNSLPTRVFWAVEWLVLAKSTQTAWMDYAHESHSRGGPNGQLLLLSVQMFFSVVMMYFAVRPHRNAMQFKEFKEYLDSMKQQTRGPAAVASPSWKKLFGLRGDDTPSSRYHALSSGGDSDVGIDGVDATHLGADIAGRLGDKSGIHLHLTVPSWMKTTHGGRPAVRYAVRVKFTRETAQWRAAGGHNQEDDVPPVPAGYPLGSQHHQPQASQRLLSSSAQRQRSKPDIALGVGSRGSYTTWKRYGDFVQLNQQLLALAEQHHFPLPHFPGEHISPQLDRRKLKLQQYLQGVVQHPLTCPVVLSFVRLDEEFPRLYDRFIRLEFPHASQAQQSQFHPGPLRRERSGGYSEWNIISVSVPSWTRAHDSAPVAFAVSVRSSELSWTVLKQVCDIVRLRKMMKRVFPRENVPPLQCKEKFKDERDIEKAKEGIEVFLQQMVHTPVFHCHDFLQFFQHVDMEAQLLELPADKSSPASDIPVVQPSSLPIVSPLDAPDSPSVHAQSSSASRAAAIKSAKQEQTRHRFQVHIPHWTEIEDSKSGTFIGFDIKVQEFYTLHDYIEWQLARRYSEFEQLAKQLKKRFPDVAVPKLPKKGFLGVTPSNEFLQERLEGLERFLVQCMNTSALQCDVLFTFLKMNSADRQITMKSAKPKK